jgi:predicted transcriptional regulator
MATITLDLDDARFARLEALAASLQTNVSDVVAQLLDSTNEPSDHDDFTPAQIAAIREGLQAIEEGLEYDNDEVMRYAERILRGE